jgi:uncharacterized membrane protein (UPF0127 family)
MTPACHGCPHGRLTCVPWLIRGDDVLAAAEVAVTRTQRRRGLAGRDGFEGVLILRPCRQVHTFGMRFPIDVAFCDRYGFLLHRSTLPPRRVSALVWRSYFALEAPAGAFDRWGLELGDVVEVRG